MAGASQSNAFGLNKAARLAAERKSKAENEAPPPLEPEFPYSVLGFDPFYFGVAEEWPKADS